MNTIILWDGIHTFEEINLGYAYTILLFLVYMYTLYKIPSLDKQ